MTKIINDLYEYIKKNHSQINEVSIELTHRCNMYCSFCFNEYSENFSLNFISFIELKKILIFLKKQGLYKIRLTGGEPMLHPDFYRILVFCKKIRFFVKLNTNGLLINRLNIKILEKYVDSILFSYHFDQKLTNRQKIIKYKSLSYIGDSNIRFKTISTRLNSYTIKNIYNILYFFNKFNYTDVLLWFPLKAKNESDIIITKEEYKNLINELLRIKNEFFIKPYLGFVPAFCFYNQPHKINKLVNKESYLLGSDKIIVTPDLNTSIIYYFFPDEKIFPYKTFNFEEILTSSFIKKFNSFDWLDKKCKTCKYLIGCFGGNRINSYLFNGDFFGKDPWMLDDYD